MFSRLALGTITAALLAACGGSQPPPGVPGAMQQTSAVTLPARGGLTVLHPFEGSPHDGAGPTGSLTVLGNELYGTTGEGGAKFWGVVFAVNRSGKERVVYSFNKRRNGLAPLAGVIPVKNTLYGTTFYGGATNNGTIFALTTSGDERVLYSFKGVHQTHDRKALRGDGSGPDASLVALNGVLYGTTQDGGTPGSRCNEGCGTIFSFDLASGKERVLHRFQNNTDGSIPRGLIAANGELYGVTLAGGTNGCAGQGCGTVYEVSTSGHKRTLHSFKGGTDGEYPVSIVELNGSLYGVTWRGGESNCGNGTMRVGCGTAFEIEASGQENTIYSFQGHPDGAFPTALIDGKGTLYGTTGNGGSNKHGTIFELTSTGKETVLFSFGHADGEAPISLLPDNGSFYGTTAGGGDPRCYTYHQLSPCGEVFVFNAGVDR